MAASRESESLRTHEIRYLIRNREKGRKTIKDLPLCQRQQKRRLSVWIMNYRIEGCGKCLIFSSSAQWQTEEGVIFCRSAKNGFLRKELYFTYKRRRRHVQLYIALAGTQFCSCRFILIPAMFRVVVPLSLSLYFWRSDVIDARRCVFKIAKMQSSTL